MIDWNEVKLEIYRVLSGVGDSDGTNTDKTSRITDYMKKLISKKFKLVAKGKLQLSRDNGISVIDANGNQVNIDEKLYPNYGKNISIYISENDNKD